MTRVPKRLAMIAIAALPMLCSMTLAAPVAAQPAPLPPAHGLLGKRVTEAALAAQRGGTESAAGAVFNGVVSGNQAINVTTGGNAIGGGAFAGAAGVPVVIQNSGNNVLIQSSVVVNVQLK